MEDKTNRNHQQEADRSDCGDKDVLEQRECPKHGPYMSMKHTVLNQTFWSNCPVCDMNRLHRAQAYALQLRAQQDLNSLHRTFGNWVPERFRHSGFNQFKTSRVQQLDVLRTARDYVQRFEENHRKGHGLTFVGGTGTGKTMLASCILTALYPTFVGAYVYFPSLLARMRQVRDDSNFGVTEARIEAALESTPLLVLDEIGAVDRQAEADLLLRIVDARYTRKRPTIYVSNLACRDFEKAIDERIVSRLAQVNTFIAFNWPDWRRQHPRNAPF